MSIKKKFCRSSLAFGLLIFSKIPFAAPPESADLKSLLFPREFLNAQKLIPFPLPLDLELGENCEKKRKIDRVFSMRTEIEFIESFTSDQLEELIHIEDFVTRQLLLELNEESLLSFKEILKREAAHAPINVNKAYWAAFQARQGILRVLKRDGGVNLTAIVLGTVLPMSSAENLKNIGLAQKALGVAAWSEGCLWDRAIRTLVGLETHLWFSPGEADGPNSLRRVSGREVDPILRQVLKTLDERKPQSIAQKAYSLSKLIHLNWIVKNFSPHFEKFFLVAYRSTENAEEIAELKTAIKSAVQVAKSKDNPLIIELESFLDKVEENLSSI